MSNDTDKRSRNPHQQIGGCTETHKKELTIKPNTAPKMIGETLPNTDLPEPVIAAIGMYLLFKNRETFGLYGSVHYTK